MAWVLDCNSILQVSYVNRGDAKPRFKHRLATQLRLILAPHDRTHRLLTTEVV